MCKFEEVSHCFTLVINKKIYNQNILNWFINMDRFFLNFFKYFYVFLMWFYKSLESLIMAKVQLWLQHIYIIFYLKILLKHL